GTRLLRCAASSIAMSGASQLLVALTTFLSVYLVEDLPFLYLKAFEQFHPSGAGLLLIQFLLCVSLMILPTLGLGAMFSITIRGLTASTPPAPRRVGWAYSLNTLGAILGSVGAGFWFVPQWGSRNTMMIGIALNAMAGLTCLATIKLRRFHRLRPALGIA